MENKGRGKKKKERGVNPYALNQGSPKRGMVANLIPLRVHSDRTYFTEIEN